MEVPLAFMNTHLIVMALLFSVIMCDTTEVAETLTRPVFVRKQIHFSPGYNQMPLRMDDESEFWDSESESVDSQIDSLTRSNTHLINTIRRLEIKFDRVMETVEFEENIIHDVVMQLDQIHQYMRAGPIHHDSYPSGCSPQSMNEMPENDLMRELVASVRYSNKKLRKLVENFDQVMESGRQSMQSLDKIVETVRDINDRTIQIQRLSSNQFLGATSSSQNKDDIMGSGDPQRNKHFQTTFNQRTGTETNYDATENGNFDFNKLHSPQSSYKSRGNDGHNWNGNSRSNLNEKLHQNNDNDRQNNFGIGPQIKYNFNQRSMFDDRIKQPMAASANPNHESRQHTVLNPDGFLTSTGELNHNNHFSHHCKDSELNGFFDPNLASTTPNQRLNHESNRNEISDWNRKSDVNTEWKSVGNIHSDMNIPITGQQINYESSEYGNGIPNMPSTQSNFESNGNAIPNRNNFELKNHNIKSTHVNHESNTSSRKASSTFTTPNYESSRDEDRNWSRNSDSILKEIGMENTSVHHGRNDQITKTNVSNFNNNKNLNEATTTTDKGPQNESVGNSVTMWNSSTISNKELKENEKIESHRKDHPETREGSESNGVSNRHNFQNGASTMINQGLNHESNENGINNWNGNSTLNTKSNGDKNVSTTVSQERIEASKDIGIVSGSTKATPTKSNYESSDNLIEIRNDFIPSQPKNIQGNSQNNQIITSTRVSYDLNKNNKMDTAAPTTKNSEASEEEVHNWSRNSHSTPNGKGEQNSSVHNDTQTRASTFDQTEILKETSMKPDQGSGFTWNSNHSTIVNKESTIGVGHNIKHHNATKSQVNYESKDKSSAESIQIRDSFTTSNETRKDNNDVGNVTHTVTHLQANNDSKLFGTGVDLNKNSVTASTSTKYESSRNESNSNVNGNSSASSIVGADNKEVTKDGNAATTTLNLASNGMPTSRSNLISEHSNEHNGNGSKTIIQKTTTTTTTTNVKTSAKIQRTYASVRKDMKRIKVEPNKRNCHDLTVKRNGIYKFGSMDELANDGDRFFSERYCDFYTNGSAWTVIQRRLATYNQESFNRSWLDYKLGFGSLDDEFWFGNEFIHKLTSDDDMELHIIMEDKDGKINWVQYSEFKMKSESEGYGLIIGGYTGSVTDSLLYHNNQEFSTYDHHNDNAHQHCASTIGNGWWFKNCTKEFLGNWLGSTSTKMMVRPKNKK